ncbi:hypothetical protein Tsubulata_038437 [Turnera subulata]|uniref:O-fucosyltransferase family protein n=1 Tax=Turnera subulata TaxID=218843 RepID=A0A9Q0IYI5_9ROSI|nr:hypothetical protein Tsubulata_038437 [Turnera subulata]
MARARNMKNPFFTVTPSPAFHFLSCAPFTSLLFSPRKSPRNHSKFLAPNDLTTLSFFFLSLLVCFTLLGAYFLSFLSASQQDSSCSLLSLSSPFQLKKATPSFFLTSLASSVVSKTVEEGDEDRDRREELGMAESVMMPLPAQGAAGIAPREEREFWEQPGGEGYKPCLDFSIEYRKASARISKESKRFLVVVVSGGLNQQRNQIIDAVVIARILGAALVVPVLQVNLIWGDESEFSDLFDLKHFKRTLRADVRIVSSLPSTHLMSRQIVENQIPHDVSPLWIQTRFSRLLNREGLLILKGLDSKLSKNLKPDLQKLRCKVAFHALRFAAPVQEIGDRLAKRMWIEGPYIALHLRLEKDVWVRSGCLTGLGPKYDKIIAKIRESQPQYLTGRLNMNHMERRLAGLCPLNALEITRLLKALGAPSSARLFIAGGEPFGGDKAVQPLVEEFPNIVTKEMLARGQELAPFIRKASALAAIDYIIAFSSDVFVPSHGGNMDRVMLGHRAYVGHRKYIKPNKRTMLPLFENSSISAAEFGSIIKLLHRRSQGQPEPRTNKRSRDVIAYPVPECMCKQRTAIF